MKHRWADPVRPDHHTTYRACTRCGMVRISRHEGAEHWCEFERADGARVHFGGATPPCEPAQVPA